MPLPLQREEIRFDIDLPERPSSLEQYHNLADLCTQIVEQMNLFQSSLLNLSHEVDNNLLVNIMDDLANTVHVTFDLSRHLQQHLGLLTDSDEEIHISEPIINYVYALLKHTSKMDDAVLTAQQMLHPTRRQNR